MTNNRDMKTTELRIGNILELPNKHPVQISIDSLKEIESGIHPYQKIPLTEEWLLKFEFEKINHRIEGVIYRREWLNFSETFLVDWRGGYIGRIQYVHQLQNLYFALCNEELVIK